MIINRDRLLQLDFFKLVMFGVVIGLLGAVYMAGSGQLQEKIDKTFSSASKSGDADELTSFTGRSEIWEYGIEQISAICDG